VRGLFQGQSTALTKGFSQPTSDMAMLFYRLDEPTHLSCPTLSAHTILSPNDIIKSNIMKLNVS